MAIVALKRDRTDNVDVFHDDEIDFLSALLEHEFTDAVFSDGESIADVTNVKASSLTEFYRMTDLIGKHFLLHPSSGDSAACLQHYVAHRSASTSACIVMPKWNGLWRKYLQGMQLLKDCPVSNAMHVPAADVSHCDWLVQVHYDPVNVVDSVCNVVGPSGLTMHFQGTVSNAAANVLLDCCCSQFDVGFFCETHGLHSDSSPQSSSD